MAKAMVIIPVLVEENGKQSVVMRTEPLVLCGECKRGRPYYDHGERNGIVCDGVWHDDNWFCFDGEEA